MRKLFSPLCTRLVQQIFGTLEGVSSRLRTCHSIGIRYFLCVCVYVLPLLWFIHFVADRKNIQYCQIKRYLGVRRTFLFVHSVFGAANHNDEIESSGYRVGGKNDKGKFVAAFLCSCSLNSFNAHKVHLLIHSRFFNNYMRLESH